MDYAIGDTGRRERKRQAVHDSLLGAADELFRVQGLARTTIDDIVQAVDVARQTFFNHFPYKEALALELCADNIQLLARRTDALLSAGVPAITVLQELGSWVLDMAIEQGELAIAVARELLHPDAERAARATRQIPLAPMFEALLEQAREEGTIRRDLPVDVVASRLSSLVFCMFSQVKCVDRETLHRELAVCLDVVFNGMTDRRG